MTHPAPTDLDSGSRAELTKALAFYDRKSRSNRLAYQGSRVLTIAMAGAIPVAAAFDAPSELAAVLGAIIVVVEGLQQLFQFHNRWTDYRAAWNALERERRLHASGAGPYARSTDRDRLLAERTEAIIASENADWILDAGAVESQASPAPGG